MALTVLAAVVDLLADASTSAGTRVRAGQQNEREDLDFIVVEHLGERTEWRAGGPYVEVTDLAVHCFGKGALAADVMQLVAKEALDWTASLDVDDATVIEVRRTTYRLTPQERRAPDAEIDFDAAINYTVKIQRPDPHA